MEQRPVQELYADHANHCYGCGGLNPKGLHIKSYWDEGEEVCTCRFYPRQEHLSMPGFVYGGLIASLIDCHAMATAAARAYYRAQDDAARSEALRFVTRSLQVDYLKPTPMGAELILRGRVEQMTGRKAVVEVTLSARNAVCATGRVIAVRAPESMVG